MKALLVALSLTVATTVLKADDLGPGNPAPAISVKTWIKGEPVTSFEKGKIYVVEFWATWCGPCIQSIPHLTELAHNNKDVKFLGVSVWEDNKGGSIKKFVDDMGSKMDYHVGYSGNQDGMAQSWLVPAAQNGIPTAFIVKDGVILWVGHPMSLEQPLAEVKSGKFDLAKFRLKFDKDAAKTRIQMAMYADLRATIELFDSGKHKEAKEKLAGIVAKTPDAKADAESIQFTWLAVEDPKAWEAKATQMAKSNSPEDIQLLRRYALTEANKPKGNSAAARKAIELALGASTTPDRLTLQYAALVFENLHDTKLAIDYTNKLLAATPNTPINAEFRKSIIKKKSELEAMKR